MRTNLYDVYDTDGKRIIESKTSKEIAKILDVPDHRVTKCRYNGQKLKGIYTIVKVGEKANERVKEVKKQQDYIKKLLMKEWDEVRAPFLKVIWVKEDGRGVKKLCSRKVG